MAMPNLPINVPKKDHGQHDGRDEYAKGRNAIDEGGISQTHKGYGREDSKVQQPTRYEHPIRFIEE